jgi:hypothetical protein
MEGRVCHREGERDVSVSGSSLRTIAIPMWSSGEVPPVLELFLAQRRSSINNLVGASAKLLRDARPNPGDALLFLVGDQVHAIGLVTRVEESNIEWLQRKWTRTAPLDSLPKYKASELKESELAELIEELSRPDGPLDVLAPMENAEPNVGTERGDLGLPDTVEGPAAPRNTILYGPPGTGKTYATTKRALELLRVKEVPSRSTEQSQIFRSFQQAGRIEFVTFHQSYGYEEFVEGLRPEVTDGHVTYSVQKGVLNRIADRARADYQAQDRAPPRVSDDFDALWSTIWDRLTTPQIRPSSETLRELYRGPDESVIRARKLDPDTKKPVEGASPITVSRDALKLLWPKRQELGEGATTTALQRALSTVRSEGSHGTGLSLGWREIWSVAREKEHLPQAAPIPQYVLIIDEINRGNISKILGELITLLEPDKRLGMPNALSLRLTYSPTEEFALPPNLHILGTMNTADRSIALIDVALRRRFTFEKMPPKPELIAPQGTTDPLRATTRALLETINKRVRYLLDEDHQIGHAYFLNDLDSWDALREVLVHRVIPLLFEYFHGSHARVAAVLGCAVDERGAVRRAKARSAPLLRATRHTEQEDFDDQDDPEIEDERLLFAVNTEFLKASGESLKPFFESVL